MYIFSLSVKAVDFLPCSPYSYQVRNSSRMWDHRQLKWVFFKNVKWWLKYWGVVQLVSQKIVQVLRQLNSVGGSERFSTLITTRRNSINNWNTEDSSIFQLLIGFFLVVIKVENLLIPTRTTHPISLVLEYRSNRISITSSWWININRITERTCK